jgi:GTP-binding protein
MIDEAKVIVAAGNGGNGLVSFWRTKLVLKGGPDGGDGGDGGSVFVQAKEGLTTLRFFLGKSRFRAENGKRGGRLKKHGKTGEDIYLPVPVGTQIFELIGGEEKLIADLHKNNQTALLVKGGKGGKGNWSLKSSRNTTPKTAEDGSLGEVKTVLLKLVILAQVGLIGFPNAGKSTLLSVLTRAKPKIADYPFTTLSPNIGVLKNKKDELIVADIPGLIEGSSRGRGLGIRFLKHLERCKLLVYVLFPSNEYLENDPEELFKFIYQQMLALEKELEQYSDKLLDYPKIVVINKKDLLSDEVQNKISEKFIKKKVNPILISAATGEGVDQFTETIFANFKKS